MRRRSVPVPNDLISLDELKKLSPLDPLIRVRLAAQLARSGQLSAAEDEIVGCLETCDVDRRTRLLLAVLRARVQTAARRRTLLERDGLL